MLLADNRLLVFHWPGTRQFATVVHLRLHRGFGVPNQDPPYYLVVEAPCASAADLRARLRLCHEPPTEEALAKPISDYNLQRNRYDRFVPVSLLREAYSADHLDIPGAAESIQRI